MKWSSVFVLYSLTVLYKSALFWCKFMMLFWAYFKVLFWCFWFLCFSVLSVFSPPCGLLPLSLKHNCAPLSVCPSFRPHDPSFYSAPKHAAADDILSTRSTVDCTVAEDAKFPSLEGILLEWYISLFVVSWLII